jgi:hypothetical protein
MVVNLYCPVPVRLTVCELLVALSVSVRLAVCVPLAFGENITVMTQLAPGFRVAGVLPQVVLDTLNLLWLDPPMLQEKFMRAPVPVLVTVSVFVRLLPRFTLPKLMLDGLRLTVGEFTFCDTPAEVLLLKLLSPA